jgi:hypothetical protein
VQIEWCNEIIVVNSQYLDLVVNVKLEMTKKVKDYLNMTWIKYIQNISSSSHSHAYQISSLLLRGKQKTTIG